MPLLTVQDLEVTGQNDITFTTLDNSDTFVFTTSASQLLLIRNPTVSTINATLIGDGAPANVTCQGIGEVTVTAEAIDILTTADATLYLNAIATKLKGTSAITGGLGLEVAFVQI